MLLVVCEPLISFATTLPSHPSCLSGEMAIGYPWAHELANAPDQKRVDLHCLAKNILLPSSASGCWTAETSIP